MEGSISRKNTESHDNCNLCGICRLECPVYSVLLKESAAPRFKFFLSKKKEFTEVFYLCTDCEGCALKCPAKLTLNITSIRESLVKKGLETPQNIIMKNNISAHGNPFGDPAKIKKIRQYYT